MLQKSVVSIDMGGTKVLAAVLNSKEGIITHIKKPTNLDSSKSEYIGTLASIVKNVINEAGIKKNNIEAV